MPGKINRTEQCLCSYPSNSLDADYVMLLMYTIIRIQLRTVCVIKYFLPFLLSFSKDSVNKYNELNGKILLPSVSLLSFDLKNKFTIWRSPRVRRSSRVRRNTV